VCVQVDASPTRPHAPRALNHTQKHTRTAPTTSTHTHARSHSHTHSTPSTQRYLFIKLTYHDATPPDYEPPFFHEVAEEGIGHFPRRPFSMCVEWFCVQALRVLCLFGKGAGGGGGRAHVRVFGLCARVPAGAPDLARLPSDNHTTCTTHAHTPTPTTKHTRNQGGWRDGHAPPHRVCARQVSARQPR
jgi:hypothetical protein